MQEKPYEFFCLTGYYTLIIQAHYKLRECKDKSSNATDTTSPTSTILVHGQKI